MIKLLDQNSLTNIHQYDSCLATGTNLSMVNVGLYHRVSKIVWLSKPEHQTRGLIKITLSSTHITKQKDRFCGSYKHRHLVNLELYIYVYLQQDLLLLFLYKTHSFFLNPPSELKISWISSWCKRTHLKQFLSSTVTSNDFHGYCDGKSFRCMNYIQIIKYNYLPN